MRSEVSKMFNVQVDAALAVGVKAGVVMGAGLGATFFFIYSAYALAFG
jgi:hypothetical protein